MDIAGHWRDIVTQHHLPDRMRVLVLACGHRAKIKIGLVNSDNGNRIDGSEIAFFCRMCKDKG